MFEKISNLRNEKFREIFRTVSENYFRKFNLQSFSKIYFYKNSLKLDLRKIL